MLRPFIMLLLVCISFSLRAQITSIIYSKKDSIAWRHIQRMKGGALLVRLHTNHIAINELERQKRWKEADYLRRDAENNNKSIIKAFESAFTFCEVYFFYSESTDDVLWRDFNGVFIDQELKPLAKSPIDEYAPFYALDFGLVYFETFSEHFEGIAVMDEYFQQLKRPFPYYVRKFSGVSVMKRSNEDLVVALQKNLEEFYLTSIQRMPPK